MCSDSNIDCPAKLVVYESASQSRTYTGSNESFLNRPNDQSLWLHDRPVSLGNKCTISFLSHSPVRRCGRSNRWHSKEDCWEL